MTTSTSSTQTSATLLDEPIAREEDLYFVFADEVAGPKKVLIGPEMEKFGVFAATGDPVGYEGDRGVLRIMKELAGSFGWRAESETEGGPIISLARSAEAITLEPGCQFELSGAAATTIHDIDAEFEQHLAEIGPISKELGLRWLGLGFHPFATREDLAWVPKLRYGVMRRYLPTRGSMAMDMMLRTSTVQANYDYSSEADAMRKLRVGLKLSPLTTAIFANSPFLEGAPHGGVSYRARVWLDVDNDRSGLLPSVWKANSTFADYVRWALDVPMFMFKRKGVKIENAGQTFRAFWKDGFEGHRATRGDWQTHLNTVFPEVRLKKTIEIRGADSQGASTASALPALWAGIYYDERALAEAEALSEGWTYDEVHALRSEIWKSGLRATFRGAPLAALAERLVAIADGGLERRALRDPRPGRSGRDERVYLDTIRSLVGRGCTPADALLEGMGAAAAGTREAFRAAVIDRASL